MTPEFSDDQLDAIALQMVFTRSEAGLRALAWLMRESYWTLTLAPGAGLEAHIDLNASRRLFAEIQKILLATDEGEQVLMAAARRLRNRQSEIS